MDHTAFTRYINPFSSLNLPLLLPLLLLPFFFLIIFTRSQSVRRQLPLPPGPYPWPIIGNILHMGQKPHISLTQLAEIYGPVISLWLGSQLLVVGSSPEAAVKILKTHDRLLSGRVVPQMIPVNSNDLSRVSLVWASGSTDRWKFLRTLCRAELFSTKALELQSQLRERKVNEMLAHLGTKKEGKVVNIAEVVFTTAFNTLANQFFSKDFVSFDDEGVASGFKWLFRRMTELGTTPNLDDFYPLLRGLDLQGLNKKASKYCKQIFGAWEIIIKERRESHGHGDDFKHGDFLNVMLANDFADAQINNLIAELFTAGTDTTSSTIEWAMAELLKNKEAMEKVQEELETQINQNTSKNPSLSQLSLPYLHACIKETLRLHPPVPFLVPHRALETCEIMNYTIPKNSEILVNVWAIGRDPKIWEDPLLFKPDRFINSDVDFKGQDFEFLAFGAGRRMCPGLPMATKQVQLILASLVHYFEWYLPNYEDFSQIDMNEKFGITLQKEKPLLLIPKLKNSIM